MQCSPVCEVDNAPELKEDDNGVDMDSKRSTVNKTPVKTSVF